MPTTAMEVDSDEGQESDYPEPNSSNIAAYPVLTQDAVTPHTVQATTGTTTPSAPKRKHDETNQTPSRATGPLLAEAMQSYANQAQQWWSKQSSFGFGAPTKADQSNAQESGDETDVQPRVAGAPMPNAFFGPSISRDSHYGPGYMVAPPNNAANSGDDDEIVYEPVKKKRKKGWKAQLKKIEERNPELQEPKAPKNPRGRPRGRGGSRGGGSGRGRRRKTVDPGYEFRDWQGKATQAFMEQDYESAEIYVCKAVKANPEIFQAHSLYAEILTCTGRHTDAVAALIIAAHTQKKAGPWMTAGQRTLDLAGEEEPSEEILRQALGCFQAAKHHEASNYEARTGILECFIRLGDTNAARAQSKSMLRLRPDDLSNVQQHAELCYHVDYQYEIVRAKEVYDEAFRLYGDHESFGDPENQWSHLNIYLDLVDRMDVTQQSIVQLKRLARWFLGRKEDTFWDRYVDDDREFDNGHERRAYVGEFQQGKVSRDRSLYGEGLPLQIRVKLGIFRLRLGMTHHSEALLHLDQLLKLSDQVDIWHDVFTLVAGKLRQACLYKEAIKFYEAVGRIPEVVTEDFLLNAAYCYTQTSQYDEAEAHYLEVIENNSQHVNARVTLAKLYRSLHEFEKAKPLLKDVIKLGYKDLLKKERLDFTEAQKEVTQDHRREGVELKREQRKADAETKLAQRRVDLEAELESIWDTDPSIERVDIIGMELAEIQKVVKKARRMANYTTEYLDPHLKRVDVPRFVPSGGGTYHTLDFGVPGDSVASETKAPPAVKLTESHPQTLDDFVAAVPTDEDTDYKDDEEEPSEDDDAKIYAFDDDEETEETRGTKKPVDKAYMLAHPEVEWTHVGGAKYRRTAIVGHRTNRGPRKSKLGTGPRPRVLDYRPRLTENSIKRIGMIDAQEPDVKRDFGRVLELWPALEADDNDEAIRDWTKHAERMVATFRSMDVFYTDRLYREFKGYTTKTIDDAVGSRKEHEEAQAMLNQLVDEEEGRAPSTNPEVTKDTVPRQFHDISFQQWHRILVDLALVYAKQGNQKKCYEILDEGLLRGNVFIHNKELHNTTLAACMCCGLMFNDSGYVTETARRFIAIGDYQAGMPYQLLAAGNRLCYDGSWFNAGPTQKFMLRSVKSYDHRVMPPDMRDKMDWGLQTDGLGRRLDRIGQGPGADGLDPAVLALYGHMVAEANFSQSAAPYYFRVLALQPDNPKLHLCIATVMIQHGMKRQTSNRQYSIHQALSHLHRYYELRTASGKARHVQEAEYNMARTWHMLGLTHVAVQHYEQTLALSEDVHAEHESADENEHGGHATEDFAQEAAFALQQIYLLAGNDEAAKAVTEEWLVL